MEVAFDFGITNTDIVVINENKKVFYSLKSEEVNDSFLEKIFTKINLDQRKVKKIAVTGGKSNNLKNSYNNIAITKVNEVDSIGLGAKDLYDIDDEKFLTISAGTGIGCIFYDGENFHYLGGIAIGGGTLEGLSNQLLKTTDFKNIEELSKKGDRKNIDSLIGEVVNNIGSLDANITASNFIKLKKNKDHNSEDIAASITNMVGEVIGTISYLNAMLAGVDKVYFLGRLSLSEPIKEAIDKRLKLANINGLYKENREYGNVLGALNYMQTK
ncbi:MAG: pantothenate kinase [Gammaproteobacteria bacterium]|nr:pantothenate kinase [Gammaproteobacteria bacterium]|tara:strand:+ start:3441 stop:4253 length:813 start_codon:yes stop_codon:yes gene_type:complete